MARLIHPIRSIRPIHVKGAWRLDASSCHCMGLIFTIAPAARAHVLAFFFLYLVLNCSREKCRHNRLAVLFWLSPHHRPCFCSMIHWRRDASYASREIFILGWHCRPSDCHGILNLIVLLHGLTVSERINSGGYSETTRDERVGTIA